LKPQGALRNGYDVVTAHSGNEALERASEDGRVGLVLLDLVMPLMDGFTLLEKFQEIIPETTIIMVTGQGTVQTAVEAIKRGAKDFITKPFDKDILLNKLDMVRKAEELEDKVSTLNVLLSEKYGFDNIISGSKLMKSVFERASAAAHSNAPVFIVGETGTGKELLAKAIHIRARGKPFVGVNCGAIPKELLESELFGYRKGAFTGAVRDHEGLFVAADKGTIFLDEIGEMPKELQVRLLRVLEEYKVRPLGYTQEVTLDVRVISASNHPIDELKKTYLREDLFFRLAVIVIELPPLRERRGDIHLLIDHFINSLIKISRKVKGPRKGLQPLQLPFPGNIRSREPYRGHHVISPARIPSRKRS
jgi:DNA-binding NtrC family response regulator